MLIFHDFSMTFAVLWLSRTSGHPVQRSTE